jgi:predicted lysophospholipase L1 biosynthesis ABC-type transport system permease subunit
VGAVVAVAVVVATAVLTSSLDVLVREPARYGAPWDLAITNTEAEVSSEALAAFERVLSDHEAIRSAAGIVGGDVEVGDQAFWVQAFQPVRGRTEVRPVITAGRAPRASGEIALAPITMADLGVDIGDAIEITPTVTESAPSRMTVVGSAIVNDTYEVSPGRGGIVTLDWITATLPEAAPDPYVVTLVDGADPERFIAEITSRIPAAVAGPSPPGAVRNVEDIAGLPQILAAVISALAALSLVHGLVLAIRRGRTQLAIWKVLGLTPRQVRAAVAWYVSVLTLITLAIGIPVGVILGRLGWRSVAQQIGVVSPPATPTAAIVLAVLGSLAIGNLIGSYPGWRAARVSAAATLRAE